MRYTYLICTIGGSYWPREELPWTCQFWVKQFMLYSCSLHLDVVVSLFSNLDIWCSLILCLHIYILRRLLCRAMVWYFKLWSAFNGSLCHISESSSESGTGFILRGQRNLCKQGNMSQCCSNREQKKNNKRKKNLWKELYFTLSHISR